MNPLIPAILKLLPNVLPQLLPMADSLFAKRAPIEPSDTRLYEIQNALDRLAAQSKALERRIQQARIISMMSLLLSLGLLIAVLVR
jgi:hypothetical protein